MIKLSNKGFILTETLVVSVVLLVSFVFVFVQFLNVFSQYETFEHYHNVDSLYAAKNIETFIKDDNYEDLIATLEDSKAINRPYYDFTECSSSVFSFVSLCKELIAASEVSRALFTDYNLNALRQFRYDNDFSHELKAYITYLAKDRIVEPGKYRVILEMEDGTFSTFSTFTDTALTIKEQYRYNKAYVSLNGTGNSSIAITGTMPPTITIDMWAKTSTYSNKILWFFPRSATTGTYLWFHPSAIVLNSGSPSPFNGFTGYPTANAWHHYAVVLNETMHRAFLYIDGVFKGYANYNTLVDNSLFIGRCALQPTYNWIGDVREIKIWDRVLSPPEILYSMNGITFSTDHLLYYYKLSKGSGTHLYDHSGHNHDITNALVDVTWHVEEESTGWLDGNPSSDRYANIRKRTLYYNNGQWAKLK